MTSLKTMTKGSRHNVAAFMKVAGGVSSWTVQHIISYESRLVYTYLLVLLCPSTYHNPTHLHRAQQSYVKDRLDPSCDDAFMREDFRPSVVAWAVAPPLILSLVITRDILIMQLSNATCFGVRGYWRGRGFRYRSTHICLYLRNLVNPASVLCGVFVDQEHKEEKSPRVPKDGTKEGRKWAVQCCSVLGMQRTEKCTTPLPGTNTGDER